jgi:hypothetical protein
MMRNICLLSAVIWLVGTTPATARCACLDSLDENRRAAQELSALQKLPSQANADIARGFKRNGLAEDTRRYYELAANHALTETGETFAGGDVSLPVRTLHSIAILREASDYCLSQGAGKQAALWREEALKFATKTQTTDPTEELAWLAQQFEKSGEREKAVFYFDKLSQHLGATRGRYDSRTIAALSDLRRVKGAVH